jgi:hypothetical protein
MIKVNSPLWTRPGLFYQCVGYALEVKWPVVFATAGVSVRIVEGWAMSISIIRPSGRRPKKNQLIFQEWFPLPNRMMVLLVASPR